MGDTQPQAQSHASLAKPVQPNAPEPVVAESTDNPPVENKPEAEPTKIIELPHNMKLVKIPQGSFQMGSDNGPDSEKPVHPVTINYDFWMSQTEVTFAQYDAYAAESGTDKPGDSGWGRNDRPVVNVSWEDAQGYVKWLSNNNGQGLQCRLPSGAEWEYAARGGTNTPYSWGDKASHEYANYGKDDCCGGLTEGKDKWENTAPVRQFPENLFGLHDMHGNVWEWVQDRWHNNYQGAPDSGITWEAGDFSPRVVRGGAWDGAPGSLRSASRGWNEPDGRSNKLGFRVVCLPH